MARINVDSSTLNAIRSDDIAALLRNMIDTELSKEDEAVDTDFIDECVNALLEIEQDENKGFAVLIPLVSASQYLSKITGRRHWNTLSRSARAAIIAAAFATSTLVVNAAVTGITGVNPLKEAGILIYNTIEDLTANRIPDNEKQNTVKPSEINREKDHNTKTDETKEEKETQENSQTTPPPSQNQNEEFIQTNETKKEDTSENNESEAEPENLPIKKEDNKKEEQEEEHIVPENIPDDKGGENENKAPVFSHIEADLNGFKHNYIYGETLSYEGITVYSVLSDGSKEIIPLSKCSKTESVNMNKTADQLLKIIYKNSVLQIPITIRPDEETRGSEIGRNESFDYLITENGAYLTAYRGNDTNLELDSIDGNKVFAVAAGVFENTDIETVTLPKAQKIFENAFKNCKKLKACLTPLARYIGNSAFEGCEKLQNADASNATACLGESAYAGSGIISITLPSGIKAVPKKLCSGCTKLTVANLSGAEAVGKSAFSDCTALESVTGTANLKEVFETAFYGDENAEFEAAPSELESVGTSAFAYCKLIKFGALNKLKSINDYSFMYCSGLSGVTLDSGITVIPQGAFWGCRIKSIALPEGLKRIEAAAFMSTMITKVTIPKSAQYIGARAFQTAGALTVTFEGSPEIENGAFFKSSRLKFIAYEDSSAIEYAIENEINYEIKERS